MTSSFLPVALFAVVISPLVAGLPRNTLLTTTPYRNTLFKIPSAATATPSIDPYYADNLNVNWSRALPHFNTTNVILACRDPHLLIAPKPYWLLITIIIVQCTVKSLLSRGCRWKNSFLRKSASVLKILTSIVVPILLTFGQLAATTYALWNEPISVWCKYELVSYSTVMSITSLSYTGVMEFKMRFATNITLELIKDTLRTFFRCLLPDASRRYNLDNAKVWSARLYVVAFGAPFVTHLLPMMVVYCWLYLSANAAVLVIIITIWACWERVSRYFEANVDGLFSNVAPCMLAIVTASLYYATQFYKDRTAYMHYIVKDYEERATANYWARVKSNLPSRIDFYGVVISVVA
ncbi:hypothetical protein HK101_009550 [Irineochytrium annulatum]|nr:hypothetical protein HK101_009550 [Irineochytrium annulatum]